MYRVVDGRTHVWGWKHLQSAKKKRLKPCEHILAVVKRTCPAFLSVCGFMLQQRSPRTTLCNLPCCWKSILRIMDSVKTLENTCFLSARVDQCAIYFPTFSVHKEYLFNNTFTPTEHQPVLSSHLRNCYDLSCI